VTGIGIVVSRKDAQDYIITIPPMAILRSKANVVTEYGTRSSQKRKAPQNDIVKRLYIVACIRGETLMGRPFLFY